MAFGDASDLCQRLSGELHARVLYDFAGASRFKSYVYLIGNDNRDSSLALPGCRS